MWRYTRLSPLLALNPSLQVPRLSLPPLPPPDCNTQQLTFHAVALEFIFSWSRRKTGFSSLGTAKRGEVPLSDLMAFLSAPQAPVQVTSCALSRRSAPADPGSQATNPKILFPPPQNDSADVVETSPWNVCVLSMERLWFEGTGSPVSESRTGRAPPAVSSAERSLGSEVLLSFILGAHFPGASFLEQL